MLLGAAFGALAAPRGALALVIGGPASDPFASLGPWLDTLIPPNESPGANALGVTEALIAQARTESGALAGLSAGCRWLDGEAQKRGVADFTALGEPAREDIARVAAGAEAKTLPREFFDFTWRRATFHYYAHPEAWPTLGYDGPPQPRGFPDADQKP